MTTPETRLRRHRAKPPLKKPSVRGLGNGSVRQARKATQDALGQGQRGATTSDIFVANPKYVDVLRTELPVPPHIKVEARVDGIVVLPHGVVKPQHDPVFARQRLNAATQFEAGDITRFAHELLAAVPADVVLLGDDIDVTTPELLRLKSARLEVHPLSHAAHELQTLLQLKVDGRRRKHGSAQPTGHRLRVVLLDTWAGFLSVEPNAKVEPLLSWPSMFKGGCPVPEGERNAPSSAHRKLAEAFAYLGMSPSTGDLVWDLGAAPGGWSHVLLAHGARVVAVDRADMDEQLLKNSRLRHVRADAFSFSEDERPTWIVCDVIGDPHRTLQYAMDAVASPTLRAAVYTLKLTRPVDLEVLRAAQQWLKKTPGIVGRVKQLVANKLEASLLIKRV